MPEYKERDHMQLDKEGNYYSKHVLAMTQEGLHDKSDIAAELAYRDATIEELLAIIERCYVLADDTPEGNTKEMDAALNEIVSETFPTIKKFELAPYYVAKDN